MQAGRQAGRHHIQRASSVWCNSERKSQSAVAKEVCSSASSSHQLLLHAAGPLFAGVKVLV
jgi:hypothetical protein